MKSVSASILVLALLLAALCLASACGSQKAVQLSVDDAGSQVQLTTGQTLEVSLEGNPTTGYGWEVAEVDETILRKLEQQDFQPESDLVGAPGIQTLRFEAVGKGQTTLKLVYRRPWEKGVEPLNTFAVEVIVR